MVRWYPLFQEVQFVRRILDNIWTIKWFFSKGFIFKLILTVIAKYAGHVRQTSDDVRQRGQTLPDILSSRVQYALNVRQGKQEWLLIFASHQLGKMSDRGSKCPAGCWRPAGHFVRHARNNFRDHCTDEHLSAINKCYRNATCFNPLKQLCLTDSNCSVDYMNPQG